MAKNIREFVLKSIIVRQRNKEERLEKYKFFEDYYNSRSCDICKSGIDGDDILCCIKCDKYVCNDCTTRLDPDTHKLIEKPHGQVTPSVCCNCFKACANCGIKTYNMYNDCYLCRECNQINCTQCTSGRYTWPRCYPCGWCRECGRENEYETNYKHCENCNYPYCDDCMIVINKLNICTLCVSGCCRLCGSYQDPYLYNCSKCDTIVCELCMQEDNDVCLLCKI